MSKPKFLRSVKATLIQHLVLNVEERLGETGGVRARLETIEINLC